MNEIGAGVIGMGLALGLGTIAIAMVWTFLPVLATLKEIRDAIRDLKAVLKGEDEDDIPFVLERIGDGIRDIAEWHRPDDARPPRPSEAEAIRGDDNDGPARPSEPSPPSSSK